MEKRDYFKSQIDLLGKVLEKLLGELIGKKNSGGFADEIEITNEVLKGELEIEINDVIALPKNELVDFLKTKKQMNNENLEQIAEVLMLNIETNSENKLDETDRLNLLEKCLEIYNFVQLHDNAYSFERNLKIEKIQLLISN